ncbi:hypothetical protein Anapl_01672 [Anas platyrhynchos]|uniref:Uncharacterized protein n=1 Tax=Anas platyrhynchos TaxID=8839 RepID=R0M5H3_ANAPL|nr:hypothetical protein Anapl_01672 [Anas platyrhynchos]
MPAAAELPSQPSLELCRFHWALREARALPSAAVTLSVAALLSPQAQGPGRTPGAWLLLAPSQGAEQLSPRGLTTLPLTR